MVSHPKYPIRKSPLRWLPLTFGMVSPALLFGVSLAQSADKSPGAAKPAPTAAKPSNDQTAYDQTYRPLLKQFCVNCHGSQKPSAGINLEAFADIPSIQRDQTTWRKVLTQVRGRTMPPKGVPHPTQVQI